MERRLPDWIEGFKYFMQASESPDSYILWTAVSILAGSTRRRVYTRWIYYDIYPNMYIVLVGPPGKVHKSSTIWHARNALTEIGVAVGSDATTREALIEAMIEAAGGKETSAKGTAALTFLSSDLMSLIPSYNATPVIEFLTDIFDSPDKWIYSTKKRGHDVLHNAFLNILAGTTPSWISTTFNLSFIEQGFTSRSLYVFEPVPRFRKANPPVTREMLEMYNSLIHDLKTISELRHTFTWANDMDEWFTYWYENELEDEEKRTDYRLQGYMARKPTHLLRVAMICSLSEGNGSVIELHHAKRAYKMLSDLEPKMVRTFANVGRNIYAADLERIYEDILSRRYMKKSELLERNSHAMDKDKLEEQLDTLVEMGKVTRELKGAEWIYYAGED